MDGISRVGIPAAMLVAILWGVYRIARPLGERLVNAHITFIETVSESVKEMTEAWKDVRMSLKETHEDVKNGFDELRREIRENGNGRSKPH